jgi:hypothetical protein
VTPLVELVPLHHTVFGNKRILRNEGTNEDWDILDYDHLVLSSILLVTKISLLPNV